jgi:hypothetical protein
LSDIRLAVTDGDRHDREVPVPDSDLLALLSIAGLAQELDVPLGAAATLCKRDDVIELKPFAAPAAHALALVSLPDEEPHIVRNPLTLSRGDPFQVFQRLHLSTDALETMLLSQNKMFDAECY